MTLLSLVLSFFLTINPTVWSLTTWGGLDWPKSQGSGNSLYFDFPVSVDAPGGTFVNYLTSRFVATFANSTSLSATFNVQVISGSPTFGYHSEAGNTCVFPPSVRLRILDSPSSGTGKRRSPAPIGGWVDMDKAWYSNQAHFEFQQSGSPVNEGTFTITVPLTLDQWSNINGYTGTQRPTQFATSMTSVIAVGMSFGGGCFFGHGLNTENGTVRFTLLDYEVN